jgi:hypothetical protein
VWQKIFISKRAVAARHGNGCFPKLDWREARTESGGLLDASRQQLEPGAEAFFADTAVCLIVDIGGTDAEGLEGGRPTREFPHLIDAGKPRTIVNDRDLLT